MIRPKVRACLFAFCAGTLCASVRAGVSLFEREVVLRFEREVVLRFDASLL